MAGALAFIAILTMTGGCEDTVAGSLVMYYVSACAAVVLCVQMQRRAQLWSLQLERACL